MGKYDAADNIQVIDRIPGFKPGAYLAEVIRLSEVGKAKEFFFAEFNVLESEGEGATPAGTVARYMENTNSKYPDSAMKGIKEAVAAIIGEPASKVKGVMIEELVKPANPAKGKRVRLVVKNRDGKPDDQFPKYSFRQV